MKAQRVPESGQGTARRRALQLSCCLAGVGKVLEGQEKVPRTMRNGGHKETMMEKHDKEPEYVTEKTDQTMGPS